MRGWYSSDALNLNSLRLRFHGQKAVSGADRRGSSGHGCALATEYGGGERRRRRAEEGAAGDVQHGPDDPPDPREEGVRYARQGGPRVRLPSSGRQAAGAQPRVTASSEPALRGLAEPPRAERARGRGDRAGGTRPVAGAHRAGVEAY